MEEYLRIEKLQEIKKKPPHNQKDIFYRNESKTMNVYEISLDLLIFNQYNGRIATFVKTHEKLHGAINAATPGGAKDITQFLWDSQKIRNLHTQKDLVERGQLECGIVTADGVVIDGNRRFMLLKKNAEKNNQATAYFRAIILEDTIASNPKEIMRLETTYQMGVDDKVDYNPIQKYLKCRDLIDEGFSEEEIAKMMGEKTVRIKDYLSTLTLMDKYLAEYDYDGMYRVLEIQKLEGHFVDLNNYLSRYTPEGRKVTDMDWSPDPEDIDDVKTIYFDYMRAGFGVHDIRHIANPAKDKGIFTTEKLWKEFSEGYFFEIENIKNEEVPLQEIRESNSNTDIIDLISSRDADFSKKSEDTTKGNLGRAKRNLEDKNSQDEPLELLQRALRTLESINTDVESFRSQEVRATSHEIRKMVEDFIKIVDGKA